MKSSTYEKKLKLLEDEIKRTNPYFKNKLRQMKEEAEKLRAKFEEKKQLEVIERAKIISKYSEPEPEPEPERDVEWPDDIEMEGEYVRPCTPYYCNCGDWVTGLIQHQGSWVCPNCLCGIDE